MNIIRNISTLIYKNTQNVAQAFLELRVSRAACAALQTSCDSIQDKGERILLAIPTTGPLIPAIVLGISFASSVYYSNIPLLHTSCIFLFHTAQEMFSLDTLSHAAANGETDKVRLILESRLLPDQFFRLTDSDGWTSLHYAAKNGHEDAFRLILESFSADTYPNPSDREGWTPLHEAALQGFENIVQMILERLPSSADSNPANTEGWTPLHYAAAKGHKQIVVMILNCLPQDANPNPANNRGWTPLDAATMEDQKDICSLIREFSLHRTKFNLTSSEGESS